MNKKGEVEQRFVNFQGKTEVRADNQDKIISGYAAVFEEWSNPMYWFKEKIARGAFDSTDTSNCIACFNHNEENLLARTSSETLKLEVDDIGLRFEFKVPNTTLGNDLYELIQRGDISQCSFKFIVDEDSWLYSDDDNNLDERTILKIGQLYDVSLVIYPAYNATSCDARSAEMLEERKKEFLKNKNNNKNSIEAESRARLCQLLSLGKQN